MYRRVKARPPPGAEKWSTCYGCKDPIKTGQAEEVVAEDERYHANCAPRIPLVQKDSDEVPENITLV